MPNSASVHEILNDSRRLREEMRMLREALKLDIEKLLHALNESKKRLDYHWEQASAARHCSRLFFAKTFNHSGDKLNP